jgi:hypothetical protein
LFSFALFSTPRAFFHSPPQTVRRTVVTYLPGTGTGTRSPNRDVQAPCPRRPTSSDNLKPPYCVPTTRLTRIESRQLESPSVK